MCSNGNAQRRTKTDRDRSPNSRNDLGDINITHLNVLKLYHLIVSSIHASLKFVGKTCLKYNEIGGGVRVHSSELRRI